MRTVLLPQGQSVPALGQGTWRMGEEWLQRATEIAALRTGIDLGMTLIDTAEMYGDGATETFLGAALEGIRDRVFLVSKVYPHNAGGRKLINACEASLRRLRTDWLDLYLLHWMGDIPLAETVTGMEALRAAGKIRSWGVSNLDLADIQDWNVRAEGPAPPTRSFTMSPAAVLNSICCRHWPRKAFPPWRIARSSKAACRPAGRCRPLPIGMAPRCIRSPWPG